MAFARPTLTQIVDRIISDMETKLGIGTLLRISVLKILAKVIGGSHHLIYGFLEYMSKQIFVSSADTTYLEEAAGEWGIVRSGSSFAVGSGMAAGTPGVTIPAGSKLQTLDGIVYVVDADTVMEAPGYVTIDFTAEVAGASGDQDGGILLNFVSPIAGINTTVMVDSNGAHSGSDEEVDDELRARVLYRKRHPPHGGSEPDIESWCKEISGITRVWIIPQYRGDGTFGVAFTRDDDASIIPTAGQMAIVSNYLIEHTDPLTGESIGLPICGAAGLYMISLTELDVDFEIDINPNTATVRAAVQAELEDLIYREGGPEQTLYISRIDEAISSALGEGRHNLVSPTSDVIADDNQVHVLGTITWGTLP